MKNHSATHKNCACNGRFETASKEEVYWFASRLLPAAERDTKYILDAYTSQWRIKHPGIDPVFEDGFPKDMAHEAVGSIVWASALSTPVPTQGAPKIVEKLGVSIDSRSGTSNTNPLPSLPGHMPPNHISEDGTSATGATDGYEPPDIEASRVSF